MSINTVSMLEITHAMPPSHTEGSPTAQDYGLHAPKQSTLPWQCPHALDFSYLLS